MKIKAKIPPRHEAAPEPLVVGQMLEEGRGIYLGQWSPVDGDGKSLGKIFNVIAAPHDIFDDSGRKITVSYIEAQQHLAALKNWHGHDGAQYRDEEEILAALTDDSYNGGWIIPTLALLDLLFELRDKGDLKGTINMPSWEEGRGAWRWYWSSQRYNGNECFQNKHFDQGRLQYNAAKNCWISCRLVRLEPVA